MTKLRLLIRYTDLLTFVDLEGTDMCRMTLVTRGRDEHPTMFEGSDEDVINRGLAAVEAGLTHTLKEELRKAMDELLFPTFEEFMELHRRDERAPESLNASDWLERYRSAKESYTKHGSEPPLGVKVKAFDPNRFGHYRTFFLQPYEVDGALVADEDRLLLTPNSSADSFQSWVLPKSEWWRFVAVVPNDT